MKNKIILNILLSMGIVIVYIFAGYEICVKGVSYECMDLYVFFVLSVIFSLFLGIVSCLWIMVNGKEWHNIVFISSGIVNLIVSCIFLLFLDDSIMELNFLLSLLLTLPISVFIWQIYVVASYENKVIRYTD